jgi:hypothetical protein
MQGHYNLYYVLLADKEANQMLAETKERILQELLRLCKKDKPP